MRDQRAYLAAYYTKHKVAYKVKAANYYLAHKAEIVARGEVYRKANPEAIALLGAKYRCTRRSHHAYARYGGRGIKFRLTLSELIGTIGRRPSTAHSLDRINNDGHYEIGNIRWATHLEQSRNRHHQNQYTKCRA